MSRLRSTKWKCQQQVSPDGSLCGDVATYRCNACKQYFCDECFIDHLHMTIVVKEGEKNETPLGRDHAAEGRADKEGKMGDRQ